MAPVQGGNFSLSGWMIEHFHFIRVFLRFRHWMEQPREDYLFKAAVRDRGQVRDIGFSEERKRELLQRELEAREEGWTGHEAHGGSAALTLAEERVFPQVIDLVGADKLIFFELPLSFRITRSLGDSKYRAERSEALSAEYGIPLLRMADPKELPLESWMRDGLHMEKDGIEAFSSWLGRALAELEMQPEMENGSGEAK